MGRRSRLHLATAAVLLAGCGSSDPPAAEQPAQGAAVPDVVETTLESTGARVVLDRRARTLRVGDDQVPAGVGPGGVVTEGDRVYVTDPANDGLLVFQTRPELRLNRRVAVAGRPFRIVKQGNSLGVTLDDDGSEARFTGESRPRRLPAP